MWAMIILLLMIQQGPVSNGSDLGSCLNDRGPPIDLRHVMLLPSHELTMDSRVGRVRISLDGQRFSLYLISSPDDEHVVGDVGDIVGRPHARADVFVTIGFLHTRPVLYWRETYQHRTFRQGLLNIEPQAMNGDWTRVLEPVCEGTGGVEIFH